MRWREHLLRLLYPPSTLAMALRGDRTSRRALWTLGLTVEDLRVVADARAARRRAARAPQLRVPAGADPLTMDPDPPGGGGEQMPEPAADDGVIVLGPWKHYEEGSARVQIGGPLGPPPLLAFSDEWLAQRLDPSTGVELLGWSGSVPDLAGARRDADTWARNAGWVLLDLEPDSLRGVTVCRTPGRAVWLNSPNESVFEMAKHNLTAVVSEQGWRQGWRVYDPGRREMDAHGPQTGPEGERLLRVALHALGVEVLDG